MLYSMFGLPPEVAAFFMFPAGRRALVFAVLLSAFLGLAACGGSGDEETSEAVVPQAAPPEPVASSEVPVDAVAVVDGESIAKADFDAVIDRVEMSFEQQQRDFPQPGTAEYEVLKSQALEFLVQRVEFRQQAAALGIVVTDAQVTERLMQLKEEFFANDDDAYTEQLEAQGLTEDQVKEELRAQLISEGLFEAVTKDVTVPAAEVESFYSENQALFGEPASREVRHILVSQKQEAEGIRDRILAGEAFDELAKTLSLDQGTSDQGGMLTVEQGATAAPFDEFSFAAETGELSEPIETQFGWHIIEILGDIVPESVSDLGEVRSTIEAQLLESRQNEVMTTWVADLGNVYAGKIGYAIGFTPTPSPAPGTRDSGAVGGGADGGTGTGN